MKRRQQSSRVVLNAVALWRLLDQRNISQNELARLVGTSSGYMSDLVSGKRSPSPPTRRRLQQALGVREFDDLFIWETGEDQRWRTRKVGGADTHKDGINGGSIRKRSPLGPTFARRSEVR